MNLQEIKEIAKRHNLKIGKGGKTELVRAIQVAEGNLPCFASHTASDCGQSDCLWRSDCT